MIPVNSRSEIPENMTETEEHEFWKTHEVGPGLVTETAHDSEAQAEMGAVLSAIRLRRQKSTPTSLRLSVDLERRLRHLAELKHTNYQTLLKEFVLERVYEEEKRLGVV